MIISVNWLKKYTDIDLSIDELVKVIGARIVEVESVTALSEKYKDVIIVRVEECAPLPETDHLNVTKINDGGYSKDIERDEKGLISVVCGAPNVRAGMLVAWLPPHSIVPESFCDAEPFVLQSKKLRGVMSNGMIASARELDLYDEHAGILEVDKEVEPGTKFATVYELDDYLLDIENKSLTHRPDMFGIIGFAREVAAIQEKSFVTPDWLAETVPELAKIKPSIEDIIVNIESPEICARYQAVVLSDVDASRKSPLEIQNYLARVGVRPINAVVDVTNYLMMLTGQPLHAFDYDKLVQVSRNRPEITVRLAKDGEKLLLLDGREVELSVEDILITAGGAPIGLAGAMGGANTAIDEHTKNIIVESATFNLYSLRSTQMRHGIFSEAITRFTKGQPSALTAPVLASAIELIEAWSGAKMVSNVMDARVKTVPNSSISLSTGRLNNFLGSAMTTEDIEVTLRSVEFACVSENHNLLEVDAPYWRSDIHIPEDLIEEVGRLKGFDSIQPTLPVRDSAAIMPSKYDKFRNRLRLLIAETGANEVLTYSFVHGDVIQKSGQTIDNSYRITNSISPDLQYYRQSLLPSLMGLVRPNIKNGFDDFAIFEFNKVHPKSLGLTDESVPVEHDSVALVIASKSIAKGSPYYKAKNILNYLELKLGLELFFGHLDSQSDAAVVAPLESRRSAVVKTADGSIIGYVGEFKNNVKKNFKLTDNVACFELDLKALFGAVESLKSDYTPLSKYPSVERDICFQTGHEVNYRDVYDLVDEVCSRNEIDFCISPVDIYQLDGGNSRNITLRIKFTSPNKTFTGVEIKSVVDDISLRAEEKLSVKII